MASKRDTVNRIKTNFPHELTELAQWVCWRIESRDGKPTKIPYSVNGHMARSDNPATWASFDAACKAFLNGNYSGVGFVFSEHDPYVGIDFDKCIGNGQIDPQKWDLVCRLGSYTEVSQSGTGVHIIAKGLLPPGGRKSNQYQIEMYDRKRFFVVTGDVLPDYHPVIADRQRELEQFHTMIFPAREQTAQPHHSSGNGQIPADDQAILERMFASKNGGDIQALWFGNKSAYNNDESAADLALCNHLAFWTGNDAARMDRLFRQSRLYREHKWNRNARTGEKYGEGTIARAIAATKETYSARRQESCAIQTVESAAPTVHLNGNDSHNHAETSVNSVEPPAADSGYAKDAEPETPSNQIDALHYRAEDGGILDAWLEHFGDDWLFSVGPDQWRFWFDTHWKLDDELIVSKQILNLMDTMNRQCSKFMREAPDKIKAISNKYAMLGIDMPDSAINQIEDIKTKHSVAKSLHTATKRSSSKIGSVEIMARNARAAAVSKFDIDESLNLLNGVLSLRSLELRPHGRDELFTYCLDYEYSPDATCPLFEKFVSEVLVKEGTTETDESLVMLFQELLGYSMTPDVRHEVMVWMYGDGSNGKSVAISVIEALLGPMSLSIDFQTIGTPGNYDLSDVPGKRVLFSTEAEKGRAMAESYIKRIVTGDTLSARPIYGSTIKFKSTAKIWWAMNDKPIIKDTTDAMWRRMKLIPFFRKFVEGKTADPDLTKKLMNELPGILNWALAGLVRLKLNNKFTKSDASEAAKAEYRQEANPVAQWLSTMTVRTDYPATLAGALFESFRFWCEKSNERAITATQFGRDLTRLKVESKRVSTGVKYHLSLIDNRDRERD